jgi:hypothetical protein
MKLADRTHCLHGHEFTPENTRIRNGARVCRKCVQDWKRKHKRKTPWTQEQLHALMRKHRQLHMALPSAGAGAVKNSYKRRATDSRQQLIELLKSAPCADCGGRFPSECMDFDHIDASQKVASVSDLVWGAESIDAILAEIDKCELVCSNCHSVRTSRRQNEKANASREGDDESHRRYLELTARRMPWTRPGRGTAR